MNECDIYVAEEILKRLKNRNGCVTGVDIEVLETDEAQYYRICCSLCNFGAAIKGSIGLSGTEKTGYIISKGGARYIYAQEQENTNAIALQNEDLELSVAEKKRNKYYSVVALVISLLSFIISAAAFIISLR